MTNIQNIDDNECFKWYLFRCLDPAIYQSARFTIADKDFSKRLDFEDIQSPVKSRDIHKIEKKNSIGVSVFGYEYKEKHPSYVSEKKNAVKENMLICC